MSASTGANPQACEFMRRCLALAARGLGLVEPNPIAGCVIARDGKIVAEGWHREFGRAHAEVNALLQAGEAARGAELYVSLEPCSTFDKTPPCTDAIISAGIRRVLYGASDETQRGHEVLRKAGIQVEGNILAEDCRSANPYFFRLPRGDRPFVMAKWAMSADARLVVPARVGSRWISGEESRTIAHRWRSAVDALAVGIETVLADDPLLTCRVGLPSPKRVVFDANARTPLTSRLVQTARETPLIIVVARDAPLESARALEKNGCMLVRAVRNGRTLDLHDALSRLLAETQICTIMIEGGPTLLESAFRAAVVDETRVFAAPVVIGDDRNPLPIATWALEAVAAAMRSQDTIYHRCLFDLLVINRGLRL